MRRRLRPILTLAAIALLVPVRVAAQNLGEYAGSWQATETWSDQELGLEPARFQLEIRPLRDGGFAARWTNPPLPADEQVVEQVDARLVPTERRGVFALDTPEPSLIEKLFASPATGNPLDRETLVWARMSESALLLYSLSIGEDGHPALIRTAYQIENGGLSFEREARLGADEPIVIRGRLVRRGG